MLESVCSGEKGRGECVEFEEGTSSVGKQIHGFAAAGTIDCVMSYSYHPAVSCTFCLQRQNLPLSQVSGRKMTFLFQFWSFFPFPKCF